MISHEEILRILNNRYACKNFDKDKKIKDEDFRLILESARLSASSFGMEPWHFLVIEDESLKEELKEFAWGARNSLNGASHFIIIFARKKIDLLVESDYIQNIMTKIKNLSGDILDTRKKFYDNFQKVDFDLLSDDRYIFDWACKQTYLALANMLMVSSMIGIDTCPIEGFSREKVENLLISRGLLDSAHFGVSVMAGFGYRLEQITPKTRRELEDIVTYLK